MQIFVLLVLSFFQISALQFLYQDTQFGRVRGKWLRTRQNKLVGAFLGIPFAEPPIGPLRFKNPQPWTKMWKNIRKATKDGPICPQLNHRGNLVGHEDCLHLNIFVPYKENGKVAVKYDEQFPVLVYVHGGAFIIGSNNSTRISPEYMLDHNIILVSINYRLNFLGFLSTGNNISPGNYGLKDVIMALKWVQENIHSFGGNATSVTLQGHSSGSAITQLLSLNNKTEDLFHKMIAQSGSAFASWAFYSRLQMRHRSIEFANRAGCTNNDFEYIDTDYEDEALEIYRHEFRELKSDRKLLDCLREKDLQLMFNVSTFYVWRQNPSIAFGPTLEFDTDDAAITMHPRKALSDGLFRDIPQIMGVVSDESVYATIDLVADENATHEFITDFHKLFPYLLHVQDIIENKELFTNVIAKQYFNNDVGRNLIHNLTQLISDSAFHWPDYESLKYYNLYSKANFYFYVFAYEGTISDIMQIKIPFHYGVSHGDDMVYQFPNYQSLINVQYYSQTDRDMVNIITEMWANFIKTGEPSREKSPIWEPYQLNQAFMKFGAGRSPITSMQKDFLNDRMEFWEKLMNNVSSPIMEVTITDDEVIPDTDYVSIGILIANNNQFIIIIIMLLTTTFFT